MPDETDSRMPTTHDIIERIVEDKNVPKGMLYAINTTIPFEGVWRTTIKCNGVVAYISERRFKTGDVIEIDTEPAIVIESTLNINIKEV
jgi:hypothetical protein